MIASIALIASLAVAASAHSLRGGAGDVAVPEGAVIPFPAPLYKQCDSRWGNDEIVSQTVCQVGCLMSSTSMAIAARGIWLPNPPTHSNPGTLNSWLKNNGGYTSGNDMEEGVIPEIDPKLISWPSDGMHRTNDLDAAKIQTYLKAGRPVIANVRHGTHFVLVTGWMSGDADTLVVNDPGFNTNTYSLTNDVVGWRLFDMGFNNTMPAVSFE